MSNTFPSLSWQEAWPTVVIVDETETTYRVLCRESVTHSRKVKDAKFTDLDEILGYVLWKSILLGSGLMTAGKHSILTDTWFFYTHCARRYLTADQSLCIIVVSYARKKIPLESDDYNNAVILVFRSTSGESKTTNSLILLFHQH